jgi:hypothetical protein
VILAPSGARRGSPFSRRADAPLDAFRTCWIPRSRRHDRPGQHLNAITGSRAIVILTTTAVFVDRLGQNMEARAATMTDGFPHTRQGLPMQNGMRDFGTRQHSRRSRSHSNSFKDSPPRNKVADNFGNATRSHDRCVALAGAAGLAGDTVEAANCRQHGEQYFRLMREQTS